MSLLDDYRRALVDFTEWCCFTTANDKLPVSLRPEKTVVDLHDIQCALMTRDGFVYSRLEVDVRGKEAYKITIDSPAVLRPVQLREKISTGVMQERLVVLSNGTKHESIIVHDGDGKTASQYESDSLIISRFWDKGRFTADSFVKKDGYPDYDEAVKALARITVAFNKRYRMEPVLDVIGL